MAEVFSLANALQAGDRLKQNEQNREFGTLRLSGERQRQDIQKRTFDSEQQRANTEKLLNGIRIARDNPSILPAVGQELVAAGILNEAELPALLQQASSDPEGFMRGLEEVESQLMFALGEGPPERDILKDVSGRQRFKDTGEFVFEDVDTSRVSGGGTTGSLQELNAINEGRAARGESPLDTETFLTGRRENTAALQAFRQFKRDNPDTTKTFADFTAEQAGRVAGAKETGKQEALIKAIPAKVQAQFKADFKAGAQKRIRAANDAIARIDGVMEEAQLAIDDIGVTTTGLLGSINRKIAGTTAFALARKIDTIQANLSFDRIAEMRKNSPTGGALGQVSERELSLLGAAVVSLDQANNEAEVNRAFTKILFHYNNWKAVLTGQIDADALLNEPDLTESTEPQGSIAPEGTVIQNAQGQSFIKQDGQWVPQ